MYSRVLWKNGTFLTPQHFQQSDRHLEALLRPYSALSWGIVDLQLDTTALQQKRLGVRRLRALFPDGTPVNIGRDRRTNRDGDDPLPPLQEFSFPSSQERLGVFLVLPEKLQDGRYVEEQVDLKDMFNAANQRAVLVGHKNLRFAFSGQSLEGLQSIKVAELERNPAGEVMVYEEYVAPSLTLGASPFFALLLERLLVRIESRVRDRAKFKDRPEELGVIQLLSQQSPVLRHHLLPAQLDSSHPSELYRELLRLAGGLSVLAPNHTSLPEYDHSDLGGCFRALEFELNALLGQATPTQLDVSTLRVRPGFEENVVWDGNVPRHRPTAGERLYLVLSGDFDYQRIVQEVPTRAKLGGPRSLQIAMTNGWPGLRLLAEQTPHGLVGRGRGPSTAFFRLPTEQYPQTKNGNLDQDRAVDLWNEIFQDGKASLYIPEELLRRPTGQALALPQVDLVYIRDRRPA
ncbi:MAG: type VI secretion system baseplate subunit TssK [Polyangia bacterium]